MSNLFCAQSIVQIYFDMHVDECILRPDRHHLLYPLQWRKIYFDLIGHNYLNLACPTSQKKMLVLKYYILNQNLKDFLH